MCIDWMIMNRIYTIFIILLDCPLRELCVDWLDGNEYNIYNIYYAFR